MVTSGAKRRRASAGMMLPLALRTAPPPRRRPPAAGSGTRIRDAVGTTFTGKVFQFRHPTAREAPSADTATFTPTARPTRHSVSRSFRRAVGGRCVAGRWIFLDCTRKRVTADTGSYS